MHRDIQLVMMDRAGMGNNDNNRWWWWWCWWWQLKKMKKRTKKKLVQRNVSQVHSVHSDGHQCQSRILNTSLFLGTQELE